MNPLLRAVRGMNDIPPPAADRWREVEALITRTLARYGYREIRFPIVESTQVFARSIGDTTDIVQKEMYTFADRNGDSLTLRPEGTAACARAVLENGLLQHGPQRLYYLGPMFRHERPQKGRYRQFHQVGVEVLGMPGPDIDAEIILMTARLWQILGLRDLRLELNSLGTAETRARHRAELVTYLTTHEAALDEDSRHRLARNPLRILDSKNPALQPIIAAAPRLGDFLDDASQRHFNAVCAVLEEAGIPYRINPHLVRGLDYYSLTVFEWITDALGAQGTVCAGGRYDGLIEQMGGKPTPATGFALGLERLLALIPEDLCPARPDGDVYVMSAGEAARAEALALAEALRDALPGINVVSHCGPESLKSQLKRADRSGAAVGLILGSEELAAGEVTLKPLRGQADQRRVARAELTAHLVALLAAH